MNYMNHSYIALLQKQNSSAKAKGFVNVHRTPLTFTPLFIQSSTVIYEMIQYIQLDLYFEYFIILFFSAIT